MQREEIEPFIGKEVCVGWPDPSYPVYGGGFIGTAAELEDADDGCWLVNDWGMGTRIEVIMSIHLIGECSQCASWLAQERDRKN